MKIFTSLFTLTAVILLWIIQSSPVFASIVINEIMPHPSPGSDWVELFNSSSSAVDLSNWSLYDTTSKMTSLNGTISGNGFAFFSVGTRLNNSGDSIFLKDPSSQIIDSYTYSSDPGLNTSLGRLPDGGSWTILTSISQGATNGNSSPPSPSPTATSTPTPTPSSSEPSESLTFSSPTSSISTTDSLNLLVQLTGTVSTSYYLKGAFIQSGGTNYFGFTKVSGNWVKNNQTYSWQLPITTDSSGSWSGQLEVMPDAGDSGFSGTGDYQLKVGRYKSDGSNLTWSNIITVHLTGAAASTTNSPTPKPTTTPQSVSNSPASSIATTTSPVPSHQVKLPNLTASSSSVAGIATASAKTASIKSSQKINLPIVLGFLLISLSIGSLALIKKLKL